MASFPQDPTVYPRRFMVTMEALNLKGASYESGDIITQAQVGDRGDYFIAIGAVQEIDYDLSQLHEEPDDRWRP